MAHQYHVYSWGAYCEHKYWDHAMDGIDQNLLTCMRKLWGSPQEQYHMEKMDNIQNNAYPKLGGHGMAYEMNDEKGAYQYHHKRNKCQ